MLRKDHRIKRLSNRIKLLKEKYQGREAEYTYYAGYDLGYAEGRLAELEDSDEGENHD